MCPWSITLSQQGAIFRVPILKCYVLSTKRVNQILKCYALSTKRVNQIFFNDFFCQETGQASSQVCTKQCLNRNRRNIFFQNSEVCFCSVYIINVFYHTSLNSCKLHDFKKT